MSVISETYNHAHNILGFLISYQMFLLQQVKWNVIITNKNAKYKLTDELPNNVRLKKISKLHGIIVKFY